MKKKQFYSLNLYILHIINILLVLLIVINVIIIILIRSYLNNYKAWP